MEKSLLTVEPDSAGERVDKYISERLPDITRSYAQKLISGGLVCVCGKAVKANYKLKAGDMVEIERPQPKEPEVLPQEISLDIVYEDSHLLVVNKPQGMVVHPAAGNMEGTLVNALLHHCGGSLSGINGVIRPGIVHRIDKDTSGLLLVAKSNLAHLGLAEQIKNHSLTREYIALVHGAVKADSGVVNAPIGRHPVDRKRMAVVARGGRSAVTHYYVMERFEGYTLIRCRLETGRTHQIRVHMRYIGHPVVGDKGYGLKKEPFGLKGQLLHAARLGFIHPATGEYLELSAPLPDYFDAVLAKLKKI